MSTGVWTSSSVCIRKQGLEEAAAGGFFPRACETGTENIINTTVVKSQAAAIFCHFWCLEMHPGKQTCCTSQAHYSHTASSRSHQDHTGAGRLLISTWHQEICKITQIPSGF